MTVSLPAKIIGALKLAPLPNRFVYLKIQDEVVYELFKKFKENGGNKEAELPPYFNPSRFVNPIGAHVTLINSFHFRKMEDKADFIELYVQNTPPFELSCVAFEEAKPPFWKEMEVVWVCSVKSVQIDLFFHAIDFKPDHTAHFTYAVKPVRLKPPAAAQVFEDVTTSKKLDLSGARLPPPSLKEGTESIPLNDTRSTIEKLILDSKSQNRLLYKLSLQPPLDFHIHHAKLADRLGYPAAAWHIRHVLAQMIIDPVSRIMFEAESEDAAIIALTQFKYFMIDSKHVILATRQGYHRLADYLQKRVSPN